MRETKDIRSLSSDSQDRVCPERCVFCTSFSLPLSVPTAFLLTTTGEVRGLNDTS